MHDGQTASNGFASFERKLDGLIKTLEERFAAIDDRFAAIDQKFAAIDKKFADLNARFDAFEKTVDERFAAIEDRLTAIETRLTGVERRLDDVESDLRKVKINGESVLDLARSTVDSLNLFRDGVTQQFADAEKKNAERFDIVHKAIHYWGAEVTKVAAASLH